MQVRRSNDHDNMSITGSCNVLEPDVPVTISGVNAFGHVRESSNSFPILRAQVYRVEQRKKDHTRGKTDQYRGRFVISWRLGRREKPADQFQP